MVKGKTKVETEEEITFEEVEALPPSTRKGKRGKYTKLVANIAKQPKKGTFKINIDRLNLPLKSVYPSIEKSLQGLAKLNGVDFSEAQEEVITRGKGKVIFHTYPEYTEWKEKNLHIRQRDGVLYLEKITDKVLKTWEP